MKTIKNYQAFIVQEVVSNIDMINDRINTYSIDHDLYSQSPLYQDILTMPMLRICELVSEYKEVFIQIDSSFPWNEVAKMRSKIAHPYGGFDFEFVWEAIEQDLPALRFICVNAIDSSLAEK